MLEINKNILLEDKKGELVSKAKSGANYSDQSKGKNRYERRTKSKLASSVKHFNSIDMDKLFKADILDVNIDVSGETNDYVVRISFSGIFDELHNFMGRIKGNDISRKIISQALSRAYNNTDVYYNCTCPDFCLHPNTKIKLLNGETVSIEELHKKFNNGESLWVYSTDEQGDFKPGKVSDVWITTYTNEFIKVTLDNGEEILTTPNHLYMMRDGSYKSADKLHKDDSLKPMYFRYDKRGYENYKVNSEVYPTKFKSVYKTVAEECLQSEIEQAKVRSNEDIIAIHHSDFNKLNNTPENLRPMGKNEHWEYHSTHLQESGVLDKFIQAGQARNQRIKNRETDEYEFQAEVMHKAIVSYHENLTDEQRRINSEMISNRNKALWSNPNSKFHSDKWHEAAVLRGKNWHTPENEEKSRQGLLRYYQTLTKEEKRDRIKPAMEAYIKKCKGKPHSDEHNKHKSEGLHRYYDNRSEEQKLIDTRNKNITKIGNVIQKIIDNNEVPSPETYKKYKSNGYPNYTKVFSDWFEVCKFYGINHKVKSVEKVLLEEKIPVYDLTVEKWSNFLLGAGVIVHNCYRHSYNATKAGNLIGDPETRPIRKDVYHAGGLEAANYYGDRGPACKHIILALKDTSWLIRVGSVIYNYINYMKDHREREYQKYIYPAIYQEPYPDVDTQLDITDIEPEITTTEDNINISEYQEIVDDDLANNNGRLSTTTRELIDDAGLSLVKNTDGSFTVRGNRLKGSSPIQKRTSMTKGERSTQINRSDEIDTANKLAVDRGRFQPGNEYRFKKNPNNITNDQQRLNFDELEKELL